MDNIAYLLDENGSPWARAMALVREECSEFGAAFFDAVGFDGFCEGYVCLTVPDSFRETWLNSHYGALLRKTFAFVYGSDFVDYKVRVLNEAPADAASSATAVQISKEVERRILASKARASAQQPAKKPKENLNLYEKYTFDNFVEGECNFTALKACQTIVEHPGDAAMNLLLVYGAPGLGKTHLSTAVAKTVLDAGHDVLYTTAVGMVSAFEAERFGNSMGMTEESNINRYYEVDLLIIDDLGTEVTNQFTTSALYNVINTRLNLHRPTIISTNLMQEELRRRYWDRITSRLFGEYRILLFLGTDVRAQKIRQGQK